MSQRIPPEAFAYYLALGPARSYESVAERYGVSKRAVVKRAVKERWQRMAEELESRAREERERKGQETAGDLRDRLRKIYRAVQGKALESMKALPLKSGMDAVRALLLAAREERALEGIQGAVRAETGTEESAVKKEAWEGPPGTRKYPVLSKYLEESPEWHGQVILCTGEQPDSDPRTNERLVACLLEICLWLEELAREGKLPLERPFHSLLLSALRVDRNKAGSRTCSGKCLSLPGNSSASG